MVSVLRQTARSATMDITKSCNQMTILIVFLVLLVKNVELVMMMVTVYCAHQKWLLVRMEHVLPI